MTDIIEIRSQSIMPSKRKIDKSNTINADRKKKNTVNKFYFF